MNTYTVPTSDFEDIKKRLKKLNKRAAKIGGGLNIDTRENTTIKVFIDGHHHVIPAVKFSITGNVPRINGYKIIARIEHTEAGNIISQLSDLQIDGWKDATPKCDHCGTNRRRRDTFFIQNSDDHMIQVGRNCLADYVRCSDVDALADLFVWWASFERSYSERCYDSYKHYPDVQEYIECACSSVRQFGFFGTAHQDSTRNHTAFIYWPPSSQVPADVREEWHRQQPTNTDKEKTEKILEWIDTVDTESNYMHNLVTAIKLGYVTERTCGIVVSVVAAYNRAMGIEATRKATGDVEKESDFVGSVGDRLKGLELTIQKCFYFDGHFGEQSMLILTDTDGNKYKWTTGAKDYLEEGKTVTLTGTVKEHAEYKGIKQTVLTRCRVAA